MTTLDAERLVNQLLKNPTVRIQNIPKTVEKIQKILQDGHENLHFISDFDMTMSRHWVRNKDTDALERNASSVAIPTRSKLVSQNFIDERVRLYNFYYPIEIDPHMTAEEKLPHMEKWWIGVHDTVIKEKLSKDDLSKMVKLVKVEFRSGLEKVLYHCSDNQVPFLVFSAGNTDLLELILLENNLYFENMHVVSNKMIFNDEGICVDFEEPLIHVLNKSEFQIEKTPYHKSIQQRKNVILMGDSLGDLLMSQGVTHNLCLNIGFLNHNVKVSEPAYLENFDIVIENDASMNPVIEILNNLK